MTARQPGQHDGARWVLLAMLLVAISVVGITGYELYSEVLGVPPGTIEEACGLGCTGAPVVTPLAAVGLGLPAAGALVYLWLNGEVSEGV